MEAEDGGLSIEELAERAGTPVRTIRYYIAEGLLPGPGARGRAATYGDDHLARLRLIRRLVEQRVPLADVRERLAGLSADEVAPLLAEEDRRAAELRRAARAPSPKDYIAALLRQARESQQRVQAMPHTATEAFLAAPLPAPRSVAAEPRTLDVGAAEPWLRLELVPGVELFVSAAAKERHGALIERLVRAAGELRE